MTDKIKATVFIPVYNGENDHLEETLTALYTQKTDFSWNVMITDSESKDRSVAIIETFAERYGNLQLIKLKKSDYSHGATRQMAAELSSAEYMVYLSQDAVPANEHWLAEMLKPFIIHHDIVAVLGKQKPRIGCFPAMKYDINAVFNEQGVAGAITLWTRQEESLKGKYTKESFYSDVCSAAPRDFLVNEIGYRSVPYSEDYEYGKDILDAGYMKAYNSDAIVEHSNDVLLSEYKQRIFDETYNVRRNSGVTTPISVSTVLIQFLKSSVKDAMKIVSDQDYSWKRKLYWLAVNPLFHFEKWRGMRLANSVDMTKDNSKHSLENSKSKG
ncbi:glycosyltransferase family 2 protein [Streptococcus dysgalactiae]|uniref:Glycosyltransferase family 2 protein n=1 Tax=Streptococcus dysgalactiae subsp. dysgalactiae TaxID=99822 RepID=A0A9X7RXF1_STRDY|nr:glycosyltransferase family 2 protein [Streptococcus dysgalactiae]MSU87028.1 glycosyltransferase family 2 protein [Streptococcus dysgalactiae subsp. dysgalactiae]QGG97377.1 glycosyltransferase family 2 protein [Streptococcus dysgalactiae subsp. dysgalactiae]QGH01822.1 glycosyltransferase family 2 protein [Streptococcus dysgalactiae subsp. dysgalactiae]